MRSQNELLSEPACAFIRHAFGCFYDAFSQIDLADKPFIPTLVFHETLLSFRSAVLRYAYTIRLLHIKRRFTSKKLKTPPKKLASVSLPSSPSTSSTTKFQTHHDLPESTQRRRSNSNPPIHPSPQTINPPTLKHLPLHPPPAQPYQLTHPNKTSYPTPTHQNTDTPHNHVTTPPTGGEWDHPPLKGWPRRPTPPHSKENETSQPTPRRESGVRGVGSH
jgi:hypothetical protein